MNIDDNILISVVIPCFNEVTKIEDCIKSILDQDFPYGKYELIIVDGMSNDGTREIIERYSRNYPCIKIIENTRRHTPNAMNLGIRASSGKFISILGAHSVYDRNFLANSYLLFLEHPDASCTGGPVISRGKTVFGEAAASAMSHPIGVGNAKHRFPDYMGYAEGACFPTFRKEVFEKIGDYDERLVRNQDDELNFRLAKRGGKVYISPSVSSVYYVRDTIRDLFEQYYNYGFWRVAVIRKHKQPIALRQIVPVIFVLIFFINLLSILFLPAELSYAGYLIPGIYFGTLIVAAMNLSGKKEPKVKLLFPAAVMVLHFSYGLGFLAGCFSKKTRL